MKNFVFWVSVWVLEIGKSHRGLGLENRVFAASQQFSVSSRTVGWVTRWVPVRYYGAKSISFMFKTLVKISSHEPYEILILSATSLIVILRGLSGKYRAYLYVSALALFFIIGRVASFKVIPTWLNNTVPAMYIYRPNVPRDLSQKCASSEKMIFWWKLG